jgi:hypothetical protein
LGQKYWFAIPNGMDLNLGMMDVRLTFDVDYEIEYLQTNKLDQLVEEWLDVSTTGIWKHYHKSVAVRAGRLFYTYSFSFAEKNDAILFRLTWL